MANQFEVLTGLIVAMPENVQPMFNHAGQMMQNIVNDLGSRVNDNVNDIQRIESLATSQAVRLSAAETAVTSVQKTLVAGPIPPGGHQQFACRHYHQEGHR